MICNEFTQYPFAVRPVRKQSATAQIDFGEQFFSNRDAIDVAGSQHRFNRIAQCIYNSVNFRAAAAALDADALIFLRLVFRFRRPLGGVCKMFMDFAHPSLGTGACLVCLNVCVVYADVRRVCFLGEFA